MEAIRAGIDVDISYKSLTSLGCHGRARAAVRRHPFVPIWIPRVPRGARLAIKRRRISVVVPRGMIRVPRSGGCANDDRILVHGHRVLHVGWNIQEASDR